jgi:uncharacterized protein YabE (DUF348 family)
MKKIVWLILALLWLSACQPRAIPVTIQDGNQVVLLSTTNTIPSKILAEAKIPLGPNDRILYRGSATPLDTAISDQTNITLTIRRAVALTVITPDGQKTFESSAMTVGQALAETGYMLNFADELDPPAEAPINGSLTIEFKPAREIVITVDGAQVRGRSAATSVGQALAEAGMPLVGLDTSDPPESAPLPEDGQIRVLRVVESVALTQKAIPYNTRTELSADLEIDQQALLQGGEPGLAISRVRTRLEDGVQVSQKSESESLVRPAQDQILGIGTKIVIRTTTVDGVTIEYWRALRLYATSYSPCRAMRPDGKCGTSTSSGLPPGYGVVAMQYYWYLLFGFEHLYIPGYGNAVVGDVGGAYLTSHYWIDLGYDDNNYVPWSDWVTVYFLTPVPANPGYILP